MKPLHLAGRALWLSVGALVGALLWLHAGGARPALDAWLASGQQEAKTNAKYRWDVRVLSGQVATHLHHEARLARDTTRLRVARDSALEEALRLAQLVDSAHRAPLTVAVQRVGDACTESLTACDQRRAILAQALENEHARSTLALARAAHADSVIATGLRVTSCKFLLVLPCLSRAHALELGLVAGVVGTLVVAH